MRKIIYPIFAVIVAFLLMGSFPSTFDHITNWIEVTDSLVIRQSADGEAFYIYGYDDMNGEYLQIYLDASGNSTIYARTSNLVLKSYKEMRVQPTRNYRITLGNNYGLYIKSSEGNNLMTIDEATGEVSQRWEYFESIIYPTYELNHNWYGVDIADGEQTINHNRFIDPFINWYNADTVYLDTLIINVKSKNADTTAWDSLGLRLTDLSDGTANTKTIAMSDTVYNGDGFTKIKINLDMALSNKSTFYNIIHYVYNNSGGTANDDITIEAYQLKGRIFRDL